MPREPDTHWPEADPASAHMAWPPDPARTGEKRKPDFT